jgi:outer membrane protein assembly factor BamB
MHSSKRRFLAGATTGIVGVLAGCAGILGGDGESTQSLAWPMAGGDPGNTGVSRGASVPDESTERAWRNGLDEEGDTDAVVVVDSLPVVADGTVYVTSVRQEPAALRVHALDTADGSERWRKSFDRTRPGASSLVELVAVDAEHVYATGVRRSHALERDDGTAAWTYDGPLFYPTPVDDRLYAYGGKDDSNAYCRLDPETGEQVWRSEDPEESADKGAFAVGENRLVTAEETSDGPRLRGLSLDDGGVTWTAPIGDARGQLFPELVAVDDGVAVSGVSTAVSRRESVPNAVVGIDVESGDRQWRHEVEGFLRGGYALADGSAYFLERQPDGSTNQLVGVDVESGEEVLSRRVDGVSARVTTDGETLVTGTGPIGAHDLSSGEERWSSDATEEQVIRHTLGDSAIFGVNRVEGVTCYRP